MLISDASKLNNGIYYLSSADNRLFDESLYISLRKKEGRLYSDDEVKKLPKINKEHPLYNEWEIRSKTLKKLVKYFSKKKGLMILETGCGNGWLSNGISRHTNNFVIGMDLNETELKQAARVFKDNKKLMFVYGDIFENIFPVLNFDSIIFSSSVQYFPDFKKLIERAFTLLKYDGEIHIVDSNFYNKNEIEDAKKRSENYFNETGFPEMISHYFHHSWDELNFIENKMIMQENVLTKLLKNFIPGTQNFSFPWIIIKKKNKKIILNK